MLKTTESIQTNFEIVFDWIILSLSFIFIFLGLGGLITVITDTHKSDVILQYAYVFIYSYMLILGIFLITYRKRLLVKR